MTLQPANVIIFKVLQCDLQGFDGFTQNLDGLDFASQSLYSAQPFGDVQTQVCTQ